MLSNITTRNVLKTLSTNGMTPFGCRGIKRFRSKKKEKFLMVGSSGQIGSSLTYALMEKYGRDSVVVTDIKPGEDESIRFRYLDVMQPDSITRAVAEERVTHIIHLASILSALGEANPLLAMRLNTRGIENVLEVARQTSCAVFSPSTIAVFGPSTPKVMTPDLTVMRPETMYGLTKVYLELLGEYYWNKFGVDFRSIRYPGIISSGTLPGGGTTDYAVEIYHEALDKGNYNCYLEEQAELPMLHMDDCVEGTLQLIAAQRDTLTQCTYNVGGLSFTPEDVTASIQKEIPEFTCTYSPDSRQAIADGWPKSLDSTAATQDWGWQPKYDLDRVTRAMLSDLAPHYDTSYVPKN